MDGHEQSNVVKYHFEEFLPLMAKYKNCMVRWIEMKMGHLSVMNLSSVSGRRGSPPSSRMRVHFMPWNTNQMFGEFSVSGPCIVSWTSQRPLLNGHYYVSKE